ncbi:DUF167 domain-containing protein [Legionella adelaidensis]|nr:DUF167 domain-containing protein [Legionella adelaidensis]
MWFKIQDQYVTFQIIAKPNAKKTALVKITEHELYIAIHAKPHKGEANKELLLFLSKLFATPKSSITLKGEHSKYKHVVVPLTASLQKIINDPSLLLNETKDSS